jgi:hypothetical protein
MDFDDGHVDISSPLVCVLTFHMTLPPLFTVGA